MSLSNPAKTRNTLAKLSITLALFLGALIIDLNFPTLIVYPIYLISILYASKIFTFFASVPLTAIAAYLSIRSEGTEIVSFINILLVRLVLLFIISYLFSAYIDLIRTYRLRFELLKPMIPQCPDCGAIFCKDGKWRSLTEITGKPNLLGELPIHKSEIKSKSLFRNLL